MIGVSLNVVETVGSAISSVSYIKVVGLTVSASGVSNLNAVSSAHANVEAFSSNRCVNG